MIGITNIGAYLPSQRISNLERAERFGTDENFITNKIGIKAVSVKADDEKTSDMCVKAYEDLRSKCEFDQSEIEVLILVTQNPDQKIPHTSAIVHGLLEMPEECAAFDISLGCSGYVYGLSVVKSLMESNGFTKGLLFTCDPYSVILDPNDKNTSLLFGDAATVTLLTNDPVYEIGKATFGTIGKQQENLTCESDTLYMNGRGIFNFAARYIPKDVTALLAKNKIDQDEIDQYIFHQGSKFILDTIIRRVELPEAKVSNEMIDYGNTVSSSIPLILRKFLSKETRKNKILISGFGVGLSWSSNILTNHK